MPRKSAAHLASIPFIGREPAPLPLPPAPNHLSPAMKKFWLDAVGEFAFGEHQLKLLEAACGAWDRMTQARLALAKLGLTYTDDKGGVRPRPEIGIERDSRIAFAR